MKYIIEIEDEPLVRESALHGETAVYRAKGFNSLVFDKAGLDKLTPYEPEEKNPTFKVGDEVYNEDCELAIVLVPDYTDTDCVLLMNDYVHPQISDKRRWKNNGLNGKEIRKFVSLAAEAMRGEE
jgi:hypothetical protein